jgi:hypothetical protein
MPLPVDQVIHCGALLDVPQFRKTAESAALPLLLGLVERSMRKVPFLWRACALPAGHVNRPWDGVYQEMCARRNPEEVSWRRQYHERQHRAERGAGDDRDTEQLYGRPGVYAVSKRQLAAREMRSHGLRD